MRPIGYASDPRYLEHLTGFGHPERPERLEAIFRRIGKSGLSGDLRPIKAAPAPLEWIETVHDPAYIERVKQTCLKGSSIIDSMDTGISEHSFEIALLAAGAGIAAADAVATGGCSAAFAAVRPPGHHALRGTAMGFCLFNNAAVAARYLQKKHGLSKVCIIDWDVHHGNGTQDAFYDDPTVFYFSIHQWPFYPGTGSIQQTGEGAGAGFTLNAPMPAGCHDDDYRKVFDEQLLPAMERFRPDAIVISAGFDAHREDPLGGMKLTEEGYASLTRMVYEAAASARPASSPTGESGSAPAAAGPRIVSLLEGGYDLEALAASVETHLGTLLRG